MENTLSDFLKTLLIYPALPYLDSEDRYPEEEELEE